MMKLYHNFLFFRLHEFPDLPSNDEFMIQYFMQHKQIPSILSPTLMVENWPMSPLVQLEEKCPQWQNTLVLKLSYNSLFFRLHEFPDLSSNDEFMMQYFMQHKQIPSILSPTLKVENWPMSPLVQLEEKCPQWEKTHLYWKRKNQLLYLEFERSGVVSLNFY